MLRFFSNQRRIEQVGRQLKFVYPLTNESQRRPFLGGSFFFFCKFYTVNKTYNRMEQMFKSNYILEVKIEDCF